MGNPGMEGTALGHSSEAASLGPIRLDFGSQDLCISWSGELPLHVALA